MLCLLLVELSKVFDLRNLCYSKISVVMLLGYMIAGSARKLESEHISLVDRNLQISAFLTYGRGIVPYIIF